MSVIIMPEGSQQPNPEEGSKLVIFNPVEAIAVIQSVDANGVLTPMRLIARPAASKHWYVVAQNIEPLALPKNEHKAVDDFFLKVASRARLTPGQMEMPIGDVSEITGATIMTKGSVEPEPSSDD